MIFYTTFLLTLVKLKKILIYSCLYFLEWRNSFLKVLLKRIISASL